MNREARFSGTWIVAAQGTGKTNLLLHMLASDLKKDAAIITFDSKGDLTALIKNLFLPGERLVVLNPRQPFAINPLDAPKTDVKRAVNQLLYFFGTLAETKVTPTQEAFLRSILRAMVLAFQEPNLTTIQNILSKGWREYEQYIHELPEDLQLFFREE
jgi:hypothetical protein